MKHRTYRGRIDYIHDDIGERGREWFTVTVQPDGSRTLRSHCEMDDTRILRDVVYTVDKEWRPIDSYVRLTVAEEFMGAAWFRFGPTNVECEGYTAKEGRISQKVPVMEWPRSFGAHPVVCDIWHLGAWDWSSGEAEQGWASIMSSPLPNGASGPMIGRGKFRAQLVGDEEMTVPAGKFQVKHFVFPLRESGHPPEHVWYHGDDLLFVKIRWDLLKTTYVLAEYEG
ncbi:MAG: hypothetical protein RID42_12770 [Alphaproteobacteria bacterium]